jgi:hypothetical protein
MGEIEDAVEYAVAGEERVTRTAIGGLLVFLAAAFTPFWALLTGYFVRVVRHVESDADEVPPPFEDWKRLTVEGIKGWILYIVFSLPATVLVVGLVGLFVLLSAISLGALVLPLLVIAIPLVLVVLAVWVGTMYLFPASFAIFARTGEVGAALSWTKIRQFLGDETYKRYFILGTVVQVGAHLLTYALTATTLGAIVAPFVLFPGLVATMYLYALGTRDVATPVPEDG